MTTEFYTIGEGEHEFRRELSIQEKADAEKKALWDEVAAYAAYYSNKPKTEEKAK